MQYVVVVDVDVVGGLGLGERQVVGVDVRVLNGRAFIKGGGGLVGGFEDGFGIKFTFVFCCV